jgi:MFS family permease
MLWGVISDRYGRKFALLTGTFGAAIGMAVFGSAKTYSQAILGRALCGLLSGNLGIIKSFLTEVTDTSNRSKAFSMWSLASTCGNIAGPLLGGYLCLPAQKFPRAFSAEGTFGQYPYLLPCLVVVALDVLVSIFCLFAMTETRNPTGRPSDLSKENSTVPSSPLSWIARTFSYNQVEKEGYRSVAVDARDEEGGIAMRVLEIERAAARARNGSIEGQIGFDQHRTTNSLLELAGEDDRIPNEEEEEANHEKPKGRSGEDDRKRSVLRDSKVLFSTGTYGVLAMAFILLDETIPLLLKQDVTQGGMSFSSSEIGTLLALSGAALLLFSTIFLSSMCKGSKLRLYRNATLASLPLVLGFPIVATLNQQYFTALSPRLATNLLWVCLLAVYTTRNILATLSFSGVTCRPSSSPLSLFLTPSRPNSPPDHYADQQQRTRKGSRPRERIWSISCICGSLPRSSYWRGSLVPQCSISFHLPQLHLRPISVALGCLHGLLPACRHRLRRGSQIALRA